MQGLIELRWDNVNPCNLINVSINVCLSVISGRAFSVSNVELSWGGS